MNVPLRIMEQHRDLKQKFKVMDSSYRNMGK